MICDICLQKEAKYTCPKCSCKYCSLVCFKSEKHLEKDDAVLKTQTDNKAKSSSGKVENKEVTEEGPEIRAESIEKIDDPMLASLVKAPQFQEYISSPIIQFHILVLLEILNDVGLTNEYSRDGRVEIASRKLNGLREGGIEANEYMEEFICWLLNWMDEYKEKSNTVENQVSPS